MLAEGMIGRSWATVSSWSAIACGRW